MLIHRALIDSRPGSTIDLQSKKVNAGSNTAEIDVRTDTGYHEAVVIVATNMRRVIKYRMISDGVFVLTISVKPRSNAEDYGSGIVGFMRSFTAKTQTQAALNDAMAAEDRGAAVRTPTRKRHHVRLHKA